MGTAPMGTAPITFDSNTLKIKVSGSIEYKDSNGDGFDGTIHFRLCADN